MYTILVVDDEKRIRALFHDLLGKRYHVDSAEHAEEALALCAARPYDLVISDINMPGMQGPELLREIRKRHSGTNTILMTGYNIDEYVRICRKYGISNIIPKTAPFNLREVERFVTTILTKDIFGLSKYLLPEGKIIRSFQIRNSREARDVREAAVDLFIKTVGVAGEMKLLLDEMITNAIYHAPQLPDGSKKYREFSEVALEPDEVVHLECGHDSEKYGVSIVDNQGRLEKETVLYKIDRHIHEEGILDDSGRGLHISRLFADRMIVNIRPTIKTEIIFLNYIAQKYKGHKPLFINEV